MSETSIRTDIMDCLTRYRELHEQNARATVKNHEPGLYESLRHQIRADAVDGITIQLHAVLCKHGI